jgi:hypothetical protein
MSKTIVFVHRNIKPLSEDFAESFRGNCISRPVRRYRSFLPLPLVDSLVGPCPCSPSPGPVSPGNISPATSCPALDQPAAFVEAKPGEPKCLLAILSPRRWWRLVLRLKRRSQPYHFSRIQPDWLIAGFFEHLRWGQSSPVIVARIPTCHIKYILRTLGPGIGSLYRQTAAIDNPNGTGPGHGHGLRCTWWAGTATVVDNTVNSSFTLVGICYCDRGRILRQSGRYHVGNNPWPWWWRTPRCK